SHYYYYIELDEWASFRSDFEEHSVNTYIEQLRDWAAAGPLANEPLNLALMGKVVASGNFGKGPLAKGPKVEALEPDKKWADDQERKVHKLIEAARNQRPKPIVLPDKLVVWYNDKNNSWYMNVFVYFDTRGKKRTAKAIKLNAGESAEELFRRV